MIQNLLWATGYNVVALPLAKEADNAWVNYDDTPTQPR